MRKNDVRSPEVSFELKYTDSKQFILKEADLRKGEDIALVDGREFVFGIDFGHRRTYVLVPEDYYERLHAALYSED